MKVIIDCDPGVDDMMAILLALGNDSLDVVGITITHGNLGSAAGVQQLARNAVHILEVAGRPEIPVHVGAHEPLVRSAHSGAPFVHGGNGLGDILVDPALAATSQDAISFLLQSSREIEGLCIIALGPLTNLALALKSDREFASRIAKVSLMGGGFAIAGNISPLGEANVYNDPEAAQLVFNADWEVIVSPLNVTRLTTFDQEFLVGLGEGKCGTMVRQVAQFYLAFFRDVVHKERAYVHDSTAVAALCFPQIFTGIQTSVDVECCSQLTCGVTVCDMRESEENRAEGRRKNCLVLLTSDPVRMRKEMADSIKRLDGTL